MPEIKKKIFGKIVRITCSSMTPDGRCKLESTWAGYPPCVAPNCIYGKVLAADDGTERGE